MGWGRLEPALDKKEYDDKEAELLSTEELGFPLSVSRETFIKKRRGQMVRVQLPPGVQPHNQWLVEPLHEEDEWGIPLGVVRANDSSAGRVMSVYVYNSTGHTVRLKTGEPIGRALRAGVLGAGQRPKISQGEECLAVARTSEAGHPVRTRYGKS